MKKAPQHLVVVDLYHEGHHRSYVEMVVDGWLARDETGRLTLLVTGTFQAEHVEFIRRIEVYADRIAVVTLTADQPRVGETGMSRFFAINRAHKSALEQAIGLNPDHILCMFIDHAQAAIVALSGLLASRGIGVSGILFRASIHRSPSSFRGRLAYVRKKAVLRKFMRVPAVNKVFCLDPSAVASINKLGNVPKAVFLPDGTLIEASSIERNRLRMKWEASETDHVVLLFGAQSARKGTYQALKAFESLDRTWVLVVAGKATGAEEADIRSAIETAQSKGRIVWDATFLPESEVTALFEACDVVLAAYPNHVGSSGILVRAASAGKPVLGSDAGLVGENIRQYGLGVAVDGTKSDELVLELQQLRDRPGAYFDGARAAAFARMNTPSDFARVILDGVLGEHGVTMGSDAPQSRTLCVQWPRFGPYHLARLKEAHVWCKQQGIDLIALETASNSDLYEWRVENTETSFKRVQVFSNQTWESISPAEMHAGVVRALDAIQPDVLAIHTYSLPDSRACLLWAKQNGKASIVMTDSKADDAVRYRWKEWLKSVLIKEYDAAFLAGIPQKAYFESLGYPAEAISLGYNAVDNAFFATPSPSIDPDSLPGLLDKTPFMLASNRFLERKNLDNLIRAYGVYRKSTPSPFRLLMLGDGQLRSRLEHLVAEQGIKGVEFVGFRQIEELPTYYHHAAFFVHPSRVDTWALVVNEAMAAGLPVVVCTGAGCHKDLVDPGRNGFLFDADDVNVLARHMRVLTEDDGLRQSAGQASFEIIARWNLDRFAKGLLDAVDIASKRKGRSMNPVSRALIETLRRSSSSNTGHSVES